MGRAPETIPNATEARIIGRKVADGAPDSEVRIWPHYTRGERLSLRDILAEQLGLPFEHRRRKYFRDLVDTTEAAFDLRMQARQRSLQVEASSEAWR